MSFRDDNTTYIRMKRDFDSFVHGQHDHSASGVHAFSLDDSTTNIIGNRSGDTDGISVQELLEKEKQFKWKEAEILAAKGEIVHLKAKLSSLEMANKRAKIEMEQQIENAYSEKRHESQRVNDVLAKMKFIEQKEEISRESMLSCQQELDTQRSKYEEQISALNKQIMKLSDDLQEEKDLGMEKVTEQKKDLITKEFELQLRTCELDEAKAQLALRQQRISDISCQIKDSDELKQKATQAEQKVKELELQIQRLEEDSMVAKAMKSQLTTFKDMEKENRRLLDENNYLKGIQDNNMLLQQQHDSMKNKLERLETKLTDYNQLVANNEHLKNELDKWENVDKSGHKMKSPTDLSKRVTELQNTEAVMVLKQGELQTNLKMKGNTLKSVEQQVSALQEQVSTETIKRRQQSQLIKRLQRKLLLVTKERDGYRQIIDSYDSAMTLSIGSESMNTINRAQLLEENIQGYKNQTDALELELNKVSNELAEAKQYTRQLEVAVSDLRQSQEMASTSSSASDLDQQTVLNLREKIASLEKALEKCEGEKHVLECRIEQRHLQGDYDPSKTKVLHFKMNPHDTATETQKHLVTKLQEENERLKQRIKLLEENDGAIEDLTVAVEHRLKEPGSSKDIEEMRSQLSMAELKNKRLMEAFKKTSQEIREVCYQLTGYKIDIPTPNKYRVTSMYADSPNDCLQFQQNSSGDIEMLSTSFSASVQDLMDLYLIQQDSIPAFLSGVTLELFSRQTMTFRSLS